MQFTLNDPGNVYAVTSLSAAGIKIAETVYPHSLLLAADRIEHPWAVSSPSELDAEIARMLLAWEPEIVLVGTGDRQVFPALAFGATLMSSGAGCEIMDNHAACRTYNVLVGEGRRVVAALIQQRAS